MSPVEGLRRSYRVAFLRYLSRRDESALHSAYELGRTAVGEGVGLLELAQVHHDVLLEILQEAPDQDVTSLARCASELFLEVLATYDMARRGFGSDAGS